MIESAWKPEVDHRRSLRPVSGAVLIVMTIVPVLRYDPPGRPSWGRPKPPLRGKSPIRAGLRIRGGHEIWDARKVEPGGRGTAYCARLHSRLKRECVYQMGH